MSFMKAVSSYCNAYYILNTLASVTYFVLKTVRPICGWLFKGDPDEICQLSWMESETLIFLAIVLAIKNTKWQKVLFIVLPEPLYSGPDNIQLFNTTSLQDELTNNPEVTWLVEFHTVWSPPCKKIAEPFANVSLKYKNELLKFGKIDLGRNPSVAHKFNIDDSVTSRQLPTLILFKNGKETLRRPVKALGKDGKIAPFIFTQDNIVNAFDLKACYEAAKNKLVRDMKKLTKEEKKRA